MSSQYLGEIRMVAFNFPPNGWAFCNGQLLPINQNQALFSLLGTTYGGDGRTTFALPNLQGRVPLHQGNGFTIGESAGETAHTLSISELPAHTHGVSAMPGNADQVDPTGHVWARSTAYSASANTAMNTATVGAAGGSQPHDNQSPFLVLNFCIALTGIFPSRN